MPSPHLETQAKLPPHELSWISIDGFKSLAATSPVALGPINLIIGPNGSGKSNFLAAFAFLQAIQDGRLYDYVRTAGGADELLHFGSKTTQKIKLSLSFQDGLHGYQLTLKADHNDNLFALQESVTGPDSAQPPQPHSEALAAQGGGKEAGISSAQLSQGAAWIQARLGGWRLYHVHDTSASSPLRKTARVDDSDYLRPDGSNLAAFLYRLKQTEKYASAYALIRKTVQRVAPFFDDFLLRPDNLAPEFIKLAWKHKGSDKYFGASTFSDGTLRFIALATLFLQPLELRPSVILVDEPELGLHPSAITLLAALMRQASAPTQIIASTQSPQLLDHFDPQDVLVANRVHSATTLTRIDPAPLAAWLEDYSLGQLWEKNEIGGRPSAGGNMAQIAKTQQSRLIPSPKVLQKALAQSAKQAQRMAYAFGLTVPAIKPKAAKNTRTMTGTFPDFSPKPPHDPHKPMG